MQSLLRNVGLLSLGSAGAMWLAQSACFVVDGGERALIFDNLSGGIKDKVYSEGLHFKVPIVQEPIFYDVRLRAFEFDSHTTTKDLQRVQLNLRLLFRPQEEKLPAIHRDQGPMYDMTILPSVGNKVLKSVIAHYDANEIITQREVLSAEIREGIVQRARDYGVHLDDVALTHIGFGVDFMRSIEQKQIAQQAAERHRFLVQKAEQERQATVIRAEGEAEAAELIRKATQASSGFVELRKIEAAREIAHRLSDNSGVTYIPSGDGAGGSNILLGLNQK